MPNIRYTPIDDEESGPREGYLQETDSTSPAPVSPLHRPLIQAKTSYHTYINTALIAVLLVAVAVQSANNFYMHKAEQQSIQQLQHDVNHLQHEINDLASNTSNSHVLKELDNLRADTSAMENNINAKLDNTIADVQQRLDSTTTDLNSAVADAKNAINEQVEQVRQDMAVYISVTNDQLTAESNFIKYQIAGTFMLLACLITFWHMLSHVKRGNTKPSVKRRILAILWMVPIYSFFSWLALIFEDYEAIFSAAHDFYEAWAIYAFMGFLIDALSDEKGTDEAVKVIAARIRDQRTSATKHKHTISPPLPCCHDSAHASSVAAAVVDQCRNMVMQFVLLKFVLTLVPFILKGAGVEYENHYLLTDDNNIDWTSPKLYVLLLLNVSVAVAFYGLMSFYHSTEIELAWCNPWPKFLCIKGVVFMTFWQGLALSGMSIAGLVDDKAAKSAQNILICIEMLVAAIMHYLFFPYQEWEDGYKHEKVASIKIRDTLGLRDFMRDLDSMVYRRVWNNISTETAAGKNPAITDEGLESKESDVLLAPSPSMQVRFRSLLSELAQRTEETAKDEQETTSNGYASV